MLGDGWSKPGEAGGGNGDYTDRENTGKARGLEPVTRPERRVTRSNYMYMYNLSSPVAVRVHVLPTPKLGAITNSGGKRD